MQIEESRSPMCRSIIQLRRSDAPAGDDEVRAAALQFVRKVSGYRQPSRKNEAAFEAAVDEIAAATRRLLDTLTPPSAPSATQRVPGRRGGDDERNEHALPAAPPLR
jgi:hypothetical protein